VVWAGIDCERSMTRKVELKVALPFVV